VLSHAAVEGLVSECILTIAVVQSAPQFLFLVFRSLKGWELLVFILLFGRCYVGSSENNLTTGYTLNSFLGRASHKY
jgi:hypothetical protein